MFNALYLNIAFIFSINRIDIYLFILTWLGGNRDLAGGTFRARPIHCTAHGLTPATIPNGDGSRAKFLVVGTGVRAVPFKSKATY